jgi:hypothetical protein
MSEGKVLALQGQRSAMKKRTFLDVTIAITIINNSSLDFRDSEVTVKDDQTSTVRTAYFGHIHNHTRDNRTISMPGYIEWCAYKITTMDGEIIAGAGLAENAPGIDITIRD